MFMRQVDQIRSGESTRPPRSNGAGEDGARHEVRKAELESAALICGQAIGFTRATGAASLDLVCGTQIAKLKVPSTAMAAGDSAIIREVVK